nr:hypothetical protein [Rubrobacter sp.]
MVRILIRPVLLIVITLSLSLASGCSGFSGDPYEQANGYVAEANEAIEEHNRLFEEARGVYEGAKEAVESGGSSPESTSELTSEEATVQEEDIEEIAQARETMQEARDTLDGAREPLSEVQDLDVEEEITQYAVLLAEGVDVQIAAENREITFYETLEQDPTLEDTRKDAEEIL